MNGEQLPRVWMGRPMDVKHWAWSDNGWYPNNVLYAGDIFMVCEVDPGDSDTIDPADMTELKTCREVDWT